MESRGWLLHGAPVRGARVDRSLAGWPGLDTYRSHRRGRAGTAATWHLRSAFELTARVLHLPAQQPLAAPALAALGRRQSVVADERGRVQFPLAAQPAEQAGHRYRRLAASRLGVRGGHDAVDRVGGAHASTQRRAHQARPYRTRLVARHAQTRTLGPGARGQRRSAGFRAAHRGRAARSRAECHDAGGALRAAAVRTGAGRLADRGVRTGSQAAGGVSFTRHNNTPPITNNNTSDTMEMRVVCDSAAVRPMSSGP